MRSTYGCTGPKKARNGLFTLKGETQSQTENVGLLCSYVDYKLWDFIRGGDTRRDTTNMFAKFVYTT